MVAQSLIGSGGDPDAFGRQLAWGFRLWVLGLPAGIGFATLRSILKLWLGVSPQKSGVHSAGNGPAMRAAIIGAAVDDGAEVDSSGALLHEDHPHGSQGRVRRAGGRAGGSDGPPESKSCREQLSWIGYRAHSEGGGRRRLIEDDELGSLIEGRRAGIASSRTPSEPQTRARAPPTSPHPWGSPKVSRASSATRFRWHSTPGLRISVTFDLPCAAVIQCGGDADSTGAIVGGIVGASVGREGIPEEWLDRLIEWPRSTAWMERLAAQLDSTMQSGIATRPIRLPVYGVIPRNLFFLVVVLLHGARRALPPYG